MQARWHKHPRAEIRALWIFQVEKRSFWKAKQGWLSVTGYVACQLLSVGTSCAISVWFHCRPFIHRNLETQAAISCNKPHKFKMTLGGKDRWALCLPLVLMNTVHFAQVWSILHKDPQSVPDHAIWRPAGLPRLPLDLGSHLGSHRRRTPNRRLPAKCKFCMCKLFEHIESRTGLNCWTPRLSLFCPSLLSSQSLQKHMLNLDVAIIYKQKRFW